MENAFIEENNNRIEVSQQCYYPEVASNSWLFSRLELLANLVFKTLVEISFVTLLFTQHFDKVKK
jgi:hypothetical protein